MYETSYVNMMNSADISLWFFILPGDLLWSIKRDRNRTTFTEFHPMWVGK